MDGNIGGQVYTIGPVTDKDIHRLYRIVKQWPDVWEKDLDSMSYMDFIVFVKRDIQDNIVIKNDSNIVAWIYLGFISPDSWATVTVFKDRTIFLKNIEALAKLTFDVFFEKHNLKALRAFIRTGNQRAVKLLETLGFQNEGRIKSYRKSGTEWMDYIMYSLIDEERPWHR